MCMLVLFVNISTLHDNWVMTGCNQSQYEWIVFLPYTRDLWEFSWNLQTSDPASTEFLYLQSVPLCRDLLKSWNQMPPKVSVNISHQATLTNRKWIHSWLTRLRTCRVVLAKASFISTTVFASAFSFSTSIRSSCTTVTKFGTKLLR